MSQSVVDWASLTTDIWTSPSQHSFISLTLHYINEAFEQKFIVLGCFPFDCSHDADHILDILLAKINQYDSLHDKIHMVVRDNASNMVSAFEKSSFQHIGCYLHILQVIMNSKYP